MWSRWARLNLPNIQRSTGIMNDTACSSPQTAATVCIQVQFIQLNNNHNDRNTCMLHQIGRDPVILPNILSGKATFQLAWNINWHNMCTGLWQSSCILWIGLRQSYNDWCNLPVPTKFTVRAFWYPAKWRSLIKQRPQNFIHRDYMPAGTAVRNLPDFDNTILRPTSNYIVIMWTPSYIQYRSLVPTNQRVICSNSSYLETNQ